MLDKLTQLRITARAQAKRPEDIDKYVQQMRLTSERGMRVGHEWANNDLKRVFNDAYRSNFTGTKPKRDIDAAYNLRKKSRNSMNRLERNINGWIDQQGDAILASKQLEILEKASKTAQGEDFKKINKAMSAARRRATVPDSPTVTYYKARGKRAEVAQTPASFYVRMTTRAGHVDNENQGLLRGMDQAGISMVLVFDGDDCGWTSHDDPLKADGLEMHPADALKYPKSHPFCQRSFERPTKSSKQLARARAAARKQAVKAQKAEARKLRAQKVEKAARLTAKLAITGVKAYRSPATQIWINNIMADRFNLPKPLHEFASRFLKYETQEKVVASTASMAEGQEVTADEVRSRIFSWTDNVMGAPADTHDVPVAMQKVLNLPPKASTDRINNAARSYGDWVARKNGEIRSVEENVTDAAIHAEARQYIHDGKPAMAQYFHLSDPRGWNAGEATRQTMGVLVNAYKKDWDKINEEAIRSLAGSFDPFPWAKVRVGKVRASLGMSEEGRRDLAVKIYRQARNTRKYTQDDIKFAKELGVKLVDKVDLNDVRKALLPRITLNPGGLMSFTIASENGYIKPVFRVLPQWAASKYFSGEVTLAEGAFTRIRQLHDEGASLRDILTHMPDELISTVNVWRNGPMQAHLKFWGSRFNGYSFYAKGDQEWLRFANRWRRYERVGQGRGQIVEINRMWSELSVMPGSWGTVTFTGKNREFEAIASLHMWAGNLVHVARELRLDYASLKEYYAKAKEFLSSAESRKETIAGVKTKAGDYYRQLRPEELASIRSFDDLKKYIDGFGDQTQSIAEAAAHSEFTTISNVSPLLEHAAGQGTLMSDIKRFNEVWEQLLPHAPRPQFDIVAQAEQRAEIEYRNGTIFIREDAVKDWKSIAHITARNEHIGFNPAGTGTPLSAIMHEAGHSLSDSMGARGYEALFEHMRNSDDIPDYIKIRFGEKPDYRTKGDFLEKFREIFFGKYGQPRVDDAAVRRWIRNNISGYAATNFDEMLSEAFTEYVTSKHPRPMAILIGRTLGIYGGG